MAFSAKPAIIARAVFGTIVAGMVQVPIVFTASILVGPSFAGVGAYGKAQTCALVIVLLGLLAFLWGAGSYAAGFFAGVAFGRSGDQMWLPAGVAVSAVNLFLIIRLGGYYWLFRLFDGFLFTDGHAGQIVAYSIANLYVGILLIATVAYIRKGCKSGVNKRLI